MEMFNLQIIKNIQVQTWIQCTLTIEIFNKKVKSTDYI